jgi:hypothetical protein
MLHIKIRESFNSKWNFLGLDLAVSSENNVSLDPFTNFKYKSKGGYKLLRLVQHNEPWFQGPVCKEQKAKSKRQAKDTWRSTKE